MMYQLKPRHLLTFCHPGALLLAMVCAIVFSGNRAGAQEPPALEINKPIEQPLAGGASHTYRVRATAGLFLRVVVEQKGIDVIVRLVAPDGKHLLEVNSSAEEQGPEPVSFVAEFAGDYRLEVRAAEEKAKPGKYTAQLEAQREPTAADRSLIAAERAMAEGDHFYDQKDPAEREKAIAKYEEAHQQWLAAGNKPAAADALLDKALLRGDLSDHEGAIEDLQRVIPLLRETGDRDSEGKALRQLGSDLVATGAPGRSLEPFNRALELYRALKDKRGEGLVLTGIGDAQRRLGEKRKALKSFEQALALFREARDRTNEAAALTSLGAIYSDLGEMQKALDAYTQALPLRSNQGLRAITINNIGRALDRLGAHQEALRNYEQTLQIARAANARRTEAETLNFQGLAYWGAEEYPRAVERFELALPIFREVKNLEGEAGIYNNLGLVYSAQGKWQEAIESLNRALPLIRRVGNRQDEAKVLNNLGFAREGTGELEAALQAHWQALELARDVRDVQREAKIRYGIARIESARNRLRPAREQLKQAVKIVESLRSKLTSLDRRAEYRASVQRYYDLYIDVLMRMGKRPPRGISRTGLIAEALQVSESARARSLIDLLTEASADIRQGVEPVLVERERELQEQINDRTTEQINLLGNRAKQEQSAAITKELEQLIADLRNVRAEIRQASPHYAALTQPQPLTLAELQQQVLDPQTLLLEYSLGEERSYLWLVGQNSLRSFTLPRRDVLEDLARRYYDLVTARNQVAEAQKTEQKPARRGGTRILVTRQQALSPPAADIAARRVGAQLSRVLLGPVAPLLGSKRLAIVSDGALQYLPFGALPDPLTSRPLIAGHEVVNLPSASTLSVLRDETAKRQPAMKVAAVFADPVFEAQDERIKVVTIKGPATGNDAGKKDDKTPAPAPADTSRILLTKSARESGVGQGLLIPRLLNTRAEAEAILALASSDQSRAAFDFAASRAAVTGDDLGQFRIVHFATHGFLNSLSPELSGLVMTLVDEQGKPQNGFLLAPEIYNLKLPSTELVVLSACQTGLGKEIRGEGIVGLTRGFMYAGAPRVIVSLWGVNDRSTAELMKDFYQGLLAKGLRPSAALRSAQLQLMRVKKWQSPFFWAAFNMQGEWR